MDKYSILVDYFDKQYHIIEKLYREIMQIDLSSYANTYVFSLKTQQFYTAQEDLFKQIAKAFENHIEDFSVFHKGLLIRMNMDITNIRPAVISTKSLLILDKFRSFRHFIRHAYDCELDENQLRILQNKLLNEFQQVWDDLSTFRKFILSLSNEA